MGGAAAPPPYEAEGWRDVVCVQGDAGWDCLVEALPASRAGGGTHSLFVALFVGFNVVTGRRSLWFSLAFSMWPPWSPEAGGERQTMDTSVFALL